MKIGKLSLLLFLGLIIFISFNENESQTQFESTATISGLDMTLCACCGGWVININGQESEKRFSELPQNSNIDLQNATFPLSVQLNWSESDEYCGKGISIESIELVE
jgi:hypothetical protein